MQQKELYVGQYRQAVIFSNQKVSDLVGMVDIYRSKLIETKENLNIKEEELSRLKGQITAGQSTIQPVENIKNSDVTYPNDIDLTFSKVSSD